MTEAGETEGRNTRRRESGTKRESETETQKEERHRAGWGCWWLWSHREAIEKSKENELCMLGPGAELGTSIGSRGDKTERQRDTERQRRKDKDKVKRKRAKEC